METWYKGCVLLDKKDGGIEGLQKGREIFGAKIRQTFMEATKGVRLTKPGGVNSFQGEL